MDNRVEEVRKIKGSARVPISINRRELQKERKSASGKIFRDKISWKRRILVSISEGLIRCSAKRRKVEPDQDPEFSVCWGERDKPASSQREVTGQIQKSGI